MHVELGVGLHIGAKRRESRESDEFGQSVLVGVELMITHCSSMETHLVHQRYHGVGRNFKHIVDGVARAVVAC